MNHLSEEIKNLIAGSELSLSEQVEFLSILTHQKDHAYVVDFVEAIKGDPKLIRNFYENYLAKKAAIATEDTQLWGKIVNEEEVELEKIGS